jgi:hypothetical protein
MRRRKEADRRYAGQEPARDAEIRMSPMPEHLQAGGSARATRTRRNEPWAPHVGGGRAGLSSRACRRLCPTGKATGLLYLSVKGVARDYAEARRLFEQGAALGNAACMNGPGAITKATAFAATSKSPGSGSRRRRRWAIPKRSRICGECASDGGAADIAAAACAIGGPLRDPRS